MRDDPLVGTLRVGVIACCVVLPWLTGPWCAAAVLLALPVIQAMLGAMRERFVARVCVLGAWVAGMCLLPAGFRPVVALWCAGQMVVGLTGWEGRRLMIANAALAVLTEALALLLADLSWKDPIIPTLAQMAVDWVDYSPQSAAWLLNAYQAGLARLPSDLAMVPAVRVFQAIIIPPETRLQLLYSLRASLESILYASLPSWLMAGVLCSALIPSLISEACLRGRGRHSDLPALEDWRMTAKQSAVTAVLMLGGILPLLTEQPVLVMMGMMSGFLGFWGYAVRGAVYLYGSLLAWREHSALRWILPVLLLLVFPLGLILYGIFRRIGETNAGGDDDDDFRDF